MSRKKKEQTNRLDYRVRIPEGVAEKIASYQDLPPDMLDILGAQVIGFEDLKGDGADFGNGSISGYLCFYDTRDPLPRPLTVQSLCSFFGEIMSNSEHSFPFKVGYLIGFVGAWCENNPEFSWESTPPPDYALQQCSE